MSRRKQKVSESAVKAVFTHLPCLTLAVGGGVVFPHFVPQMLIHNMAVEIPLTLVGVVVGEVMGHKIFHKEKKVSAYFSSIAKPEKALKLTAYSVASIALHLAIFNGAHFHNGEIHLHEHGQEGPNFAPYLPRG